MTSQPATAKVAAALVHVFTASGAALAMLMVHFSYTGEIRTVLWLFLVAMVIDGTDGLLARREPARARGGGEEGDDRERGEALVQGSSRRHV